MSCILSSNSIEDVACSLTMQLSHSVWRHWRFFQLSNALSHRYCNKASSMLVRMLVFAVGLAPYFDRLDIPASLIICIPFSVSAWCAEQGKGILQTCVTSRPATWQHSWQ